MRTLIFLTLLLVAISMCAGDLIPKIFTEPCNTAQKALCSTKCIFEKNSLCVKSDESLGYTCKCLPI